MKSILDIGKQGSDRLESFSGPQAAALGADLDQRLAIIARFPTQTIEADTADGIKKSVEVHTLLVGNDRIFDLAHGLAVYEPMVFARAAQRRVLGMLSPNYDEAGGTRLSSLKIIPLLQPYPLRADKKPDARMATMLAGAVSAEREGVGGHAGATSADFEHRATILGAISLDNHDLAIKHENHVVRTGKDAVSGKTVAPPSAVATGLTDGRLGNLYVPEPSVSDFPGFGEPLFIHRGSNDMLFLPKAFLGAEEAFGASYADAPRIMLGAGLQTLFNRSSDAAAVGNQIRAIGDEL